MTPILVSTNNTTKSTYSLIGKVMVQAIADSERAALSPVRSARLMLKSPAQYRTSQTCSAADTSVSIWTPAEKRRKKVERDRNQVLQSVIRNAIPYLLSLLQSVTSEVEEEVEVEGVEEEEECLQLVNWCGTSFFQWNVTDAGCLRSDTQWNVRNVE